MKNHVPSILALEPDLRQATILERMFRDRVHAELIVVDSRDAAVSAVNAKVPDVILRSPKPVVAAFLRALYDCDGYAGDQGVILSTSSERMV